MTPNFTISYVDLEGGSVSIEHSNGEVNIYNGTFYLKYKGFESSVALNFSSSADDLELALSEISVLSDVSVIKTFENTGNMEWLITFNSLRQAGLIPLLEVVSSQSTSLVVKHFRIGTAFTIYNLVCDMNHSNFTLFWDLETLGEFNNTDSNASDLLSVIYTSDEIEYVNVEKHMEPQKTVNK